MAGTVVTIKGLQLIAKLVASGSELSFTRAAVGTGILPSGYDPGSMTGLVQYKMDGLIYESSSSGDEANIGMQILSDGVTTGFTITEAGLFAIDPDDGEILYAYLDLSSDPQYIYPENSAISKFVELNLVVKIGTVDKITAYINPGSFVTRDGDISSTVVNSVETIGDEFPEPVAGESSKIIFGKIKKFIADFRSIKSTLLTLSMLTSQYENSTSKVPTVALVYALKQSLDITNSNLENKFTDSTVPFTISSLATGASAQFVIPDKTGYLLVSTMFALPGASTQSIIIKHIYRQTIVVTNLSGSTISSQDLNVYCMWKKA